MSAPTDGLRRSVIFRNIFMGLGGLALITTSVVAVLQSITIHDLHDDLAASRKASECRFDISTDVDRFEGDIDVTVAQIIVSAVTENDQLVQELGATLSSQIDDLAAANERRDDAVDICQTEGGP